MSAPPKKRRAEEPSGARFRRGRARVWRPASDPVEGPSEPHASETPREDGRSLADFARELTDRARAKDTESIGSVLSDLGKVLGRRAKDTFDADRGLQLAMRGFIELAKSRYALDPGEQWEPGEPLKVLLAGYTGTRNTGADVRVEEMIHQFRHLFGDEHLEMSILTYDPELTRGYFRTVRQLHMPKVFPRFLFDTIHEQHAVIACEGSMFKSKFADALSTMMVGAIGLASAEGKLAVGYGGEAGKMSEPLRELVRTYCREALIIARNEASRGILKELGVDSRAGTDTAWTFDPDPPEVGRKILMDAGWDGVTPVLALAPINAFWWPVKPNVSRAAVNALGGLHSDVHYGSVYFHADGAEIDDAQDAYLEGIAEGAAAFAAETGCFIALYGSEQIDRRACDALNEKLEARLGTPSSRGFGDLQRWPVVVSDDHDMYAMVSAMRQARWMVSSRYHACVMSMAGGTISVGVTMDERIRNLMIDRGTPELALETDDPGLGPKLARTLLDVGGREDALRAGIDACIVKNLERMGRMGMELVDFVKQHHPEFPFRPELGRHGDPWEHLPRLPPAVEDVVARVRSAEAAE
ncbi:MAG: polysaccharide pyruvyl transferase family protein [Myxococcota bacterium]